MYTLLIETEPGRVYGPEGINAGHFHCHGDYETPQELCREMYRMQGWASMHGRAVWVRLPNNSTMPWSDFRWHHAA